MNAAFQQKTTDASKADWRSFISLLLLQSQNAFNDSLSRLNIAFVLQNALVAGSFLAKYASNILLALLPIGFILLAPLAGFLSDRYPKKHIISLAVSLQMLVLAGMFLALRIHSPVILLLFFALLSAQSVLLSPAKMGILREQVGKTRLGMATSVMLMLTMLGVISGMALAGHFFQKGLASESKDVWQAGAKVIFWLMLASILPLLLAFLGIRKGKGRSSEKFTRGILFSHLRDMHFLRSQPKLFVVALSVSFYWFLAYYLGVLILDFAFELFAGDAIKTSSATSQMSFFMSLGMALGSGLMIYFTRASLRLRFTPVLLFLLATSFLAVGISTYYFRTASIFMSFMLAALLLIGALANAFSIPHLAALQAWSPEDKRARVIAQSNMLNSLAGLLAVICNFFFKILGIGSAGHFLFLAFLCGLIGFYALIYLGKFEGTRFGYLLGGTFARVWARIAYKIKVVGKPDFSANRGMILLSNHVSYADGFILYEKALRHMKPFKVIVHEGVYDSYYQCFLPKLIGTRELRPGKLRELLHASLDDLRAGTSLLIFPEGVISESGCLEGLEKSAIFLAQRAGADVLPCRLHGAWGSLSSYARGNLFSSLFSWHSWKQIWRRHNMTIAFGKKVAGENFTLPRLESEMRELSVQCLQNDEQRLIAKDRDIFNMIKRLLRKNPKRKILKILDDAQIIDVSNAVIDNFFAGEKNEKTQMLIKIFPEYFDFYTLNKEKFAHTLSKNIIKLRQTNIFSVSDKIIIYRKFGKKNEPKTTPTQLDDARNIANISLSLLIAIFENKKIQVAKLKVIAAKQNFTHSEIANWMQVGNFDTIYEIRQQDNPNGSSSPLLIALTNAPTKNTAVNLQKRLRECPIPLGLHTDNGHLIALPLATNHFPKLMLEKQQYGWRPNTFGKVLNGVKQELLTKLELQTDKDMLLKI